MRQAVSDELRWALGLALSAVLTLGAMLVGAFRALSGKMDRRDDTMRAAIKEGDDALHERVNQVRDDYVRRVDLDQRLAHFETTQAEIRIDIKAIREVLSRPSRR